MPVGTASIRNFALTTVGRSLPMSAPTDTALGDLLIGAVINGQPSSIVKMDQTTTWSIVEYAGNIGRITIFWKWADAGDVGGSTSRNFTYGGGSTGTATMMRGSIVRYPAASVNPDNPFRLTNFVNGSSTAAASFTGRSLPVATTDKTLAFIGWRAGGVSGTAGTANNVATLAIPTPNGFTQLGQSATYAAGPASGTFTGPTRFASSTTANANVGMIVAEGQGATGASALSSSTSGNWGTVVLAVNAADAPARSRRNRAPNSSCGTLLTDFWNHTTSGTAPALAAVSSPGSGFARPTCFRATYATAPTSSEVFAPTAFAAPGQSWCGQVQIRCSATRAAKAWLNFLDGNGNYLTPNPSQNITVGPTPQTIIFPAQVAPALVKSIGISVSFGSGVLQAGDVVEMSCAMWEWADQPGGYCDGDDPGWAWEGPAELSISSQLAAPGGFTPLLAA